MIKKRVLFLLTVFILVLVLNLGVVNARDIDVTAGVFHEDFSTDAYETVYDEAWNGHGCIDCPRDYLTSGSWDGTGFHRIFPPTMIGANSIPTNGGTNAISFGLAPNADVVYYGVVVRVGPTYEETAINTGYGIQNKFIILDTTGGGNRGMSIFETSQPTMWMWNQGTYYDPDHAEWDYEQVCHNHVGYDVLQAHTASAVTEPGTPGGASYWQQNLANPCTGGDFSWGYCEDNSCSYDFDNYRSSDHENEWVYVEIMADGTNSVASTSIYTRDGVVGGEIGSRVANYGGQFLSVGVGYFFNGIHTSDPNNYIDIADIYISDSPIGPPFGFVGQTTTECNDAKPFEGYGSNTQGGTNGNEYVVTSLANSGAGTLRDAISESNRYISFDVEGAIEIESRLDIIGNYITINGSTAPGNGITITAAHSGVADALMRINGVHDIIITNIRIRDAPDPSTGDSLRINSGAYNILIDHCSISEGGDGALDIADDVHDVTVQWSIISQTVKNSLVRTNLERISLHHNFYANGDERNPQFDDVNLFDMVNNVIFNWTSSYGTRIRNGASGNFVKNFYVPTPRSDVDNALVLVESGDVYCMGNVLMGGDLVDCTVQSRLSSSGITENDPEVAYDLVISNAGACPRDVNDLSLVNSVLSYRPYFETGNIEIDCIHEADLEPCDGTINNYELQSFISGWLEGLESISDLIEAINIWKIN
jgi:pectate lyase